MNRYPTIKEFCEFPLSHNEMETILSTMKSDSMFNIDAKRYERAHHRFDERYNKR